MSENDQIETDGIYITSKSIGYKEWHVHIDGYLDDHKDFRGLQTVLSGASPEDEVWIHLSSGGGDIGLAQKIVGWMETSEAKTYVVLEGLVASAATLIALAADNVVIMPHSVMMIHSASWFYAGEHSKMVGFTNFFDKWLTKLFEDTYKGFLDRYEIEDIIQNSKELWLTDEEVRKRLERRQELFKGSEE